MPLPNFLGLPLQIYNKICHKETNMFEKLMKTEAMGTFLM